MEELNQIINILSSIEENEEKDKNETENEENSKDLTLIKQITSFDYQVIQILSDVLRSQVLSSSITRKVFKVIKRLIFYDKVSILTQMRENSEFIFNVFEYFNKTKPDEVCNESIYIIDIYYFDYSFPKEVFLKHDFINSLFNIISKIDTEESMFTFIKIISTLNFLEITSSLSSKDKESFKIISMESISDALFLIISEDVLNFNLLFEEQPLFSQETKENSVIVKFFHGNGLGSSDSNVNMKTFMEFLIRTVSSTTCSRELSLFILLLYMKLSISTQSGLLFQSDIESFIDYLSIRISATDSSLVRHYTLRTLYCIYKFCLKVDYKKSFVHEILESYLESDEIDDEIKEICMYIQLLVSNTN